MELISDLHERNRLKDMVITPSFYISNPQKRIKYIHLGIWETKKFQSFQMSSVTCLLTLNRSNGEIIYGNFHFHKQSVFLQSISQVNMSQDCCNNVWSVLTAIWIPTWKACRQKYFSLEIAVRTGIQSLLWWIRTKN